MRLRNILLILVLLVFHYLIYVVFVFTRQKSENPLVISEPVLDFGMTAEEMGEYSLYKLYPYLDTPYVYLWFVKGSIIFSDDGEGEYWSIVNIINLDKKQSLLRVRAHCVGRSMVHIGVGSLFHSRDSVFSKPYVTPEKQPIVAVSRFSNIGIVPHDSRGSEEDYYWLHFDGTKEFPSIDQLTGYTPIKIINLVGYFPVGVFNHFRKIDHVNPLFEEFIFTGKGMKKIREWNYFQPSEIKFLLEDGTYFGFNGHRQEIVFYRPTEPPTYRVIPYAEAAHLLPGDDNGRVQIEPDFLTALPWTVDRRVIIYCSTRERPGFPMYEIQTDRIETGTPDEIFKLIGDKFPVSPHYISNRQDYLYSDDAFFRREVNTDGSLGRFSNQPEGMKWGPGKRVWAEVQPYADRLLYYRDGGIWTSGLDGSGEEWVFPGE